MHCGVIVLGVGGYVSHLLIIVCHDGDSVGRGDGVLESRDCDWFTSVGCSELEIASWVDDQVSLV